MGEHALRSRGGGLGECHVRVVEQWLRFIVFSHAGARRPVFMIDWVKWTGRATMSGYIAIVHKDADSDYGVSFPRLRQPHRYRPVNGRRPHQGHRAAVPSRKAALSAKKIR
jgi:hypothetical protein